jgi:hypothetical protein
MCRRHILNQVKGLNSHYLGVDSPVGLKEDEANRISRQSARERGQVVSPRHRRHITLLI